MSSFDMNSSRLTKVIDNRAERGRRLFPYLNLTPGRGNRSPLRPKKKRHCSLSSHNKKSSQTHVKRYENKERFTVLSIRFATSDTNEPHDEEEESYIRAQKNNLSLQIEEEEEEEEEEDTLPYLKYRRMESPEQQLKNLGYSPDIRIPTEVYSQKVEEKKERYLNRMDALKRELNTTGNDHRQQRMHRCQIKVRILGEEIRRKREREDMQTEEKRGKKQLEKLLRNSEI